MPVCHLEDFGEERLTAALLNPVSQKADIEFVGDLYIAAEHRWIILGAQGRYSWVLIPGSSWANEHGTS